MKHHLYTKLVPLTVIPVLFLTGCTLGSLSNTPNTAATAENSYSDICELTNADMDDSTDDPVLVSFAEDQTVYTIEQSGKYLFSGSQKGQIQIDVQDQIVHLILENASLQSPNGPAIYVKSAAKVVITIPENSTSVLTDTASYTNYADAKACLYSTADLTINGGGILQVYGYYKDAVRTKDILKILDCKLAIQAKGDGLRGNDGVLIESEDLDIQCEGTGIYTEKEQKAGRGFVDLAGGAIRIIAGEYGIRASENVYIHDCVANITGIIRQISFAGKQYIEEGCLE